MGTRSRGWLDTGVWSCLLMLTWVARAGRRLLARIRTLLLVGRRRHHPGLLGRVPLLLLRGVGLRCVVLTRLERSEHRERFVQIDRLGAAQLGHLAEALPLKDLLHLLQDLHEGQAAGVGHDFSHRVGTGATGQTWTGSRHVESVGGVSHISGGLGVSAAGEHHNIGLRTVVTLLLEASTICMHLPRRRTVIQRLRIRHKIEGKIHRSA